MAKGNSLSIGDKTVLSVLTVFAALIFAVNSGNTPITRKIGGLTYTLETPWASVYPSKLTVSDTFLTRKISFVPGTNPKIESVRFEYPRQQVFFKYNQNSTSMGQYNPKMDEYSRDSKTFSRSKIETLADSVAGPELTSTSDVMKSAKDIVKLMTSSEIAELAKYSD
jgi:hypothetical protein